MWFSIPLLYVLILSVFLLGNTQDLAQLSSRNTMLDSLIHLLVHHDKGGGLERPTHPSCKRLFEGNISVPRWNKPPIDFTHIPKTGGTSMNDDLKAHGWWTKGSISREKCFEDEHPKHSKRLVVLRQPKYHVHSQFAMCKYSFWGRKVTKKSFPRTDNATDDYYQFLNHFLTLTERDVGRDNDYACEDPRNSQTRYLSCSTKYSQPQVGANPANHGMYPPANIYQALLNLERVDLLGITYFQDEFMCLFMYIEDGKIPSSCFCSTKLSEKNATIPVETTATHFNHGVEYLPEEVLDSPIISDLVAKLTFMDRILYLHGLQRFLCEMRILEEHLFREKAVAAAGVTTSDQGPLIMCDDKIQQFLQDSAYLFHKSKQSPHHLS